MFVESTFRTLNIYCFTLVMHAQRIRPSSKLMVVVVPIPPNMYCM